jgi:hypothetical protein
MTLVHFKGSKKSLDEVLSTVNPGETFVICEYIEEIMEIIDQKLESRGLRAMYYGVGCTVLVINS